PWFEWLADDLVVNHLLRRGAHVGLSPVARPPSVAINPTCPSAHPNDHYPRPPAKWTEENRKTCARRAHSPRSGTTRPRATDAAPSVTPPSPVREPNTRDHGTWYPTRRNEVSVAAIDLCRSPLGAAIRSTRDRTRGLPTLGSPGLRGPTPRRRYRVRLP